MPRSTPELRELWKAYECKEAKMERIPFGPDRIRVAPGTADAWTALAAVLDHHGYLIRTQDTDSYNCRPAKGGNGRSLHSFGIALDVNWATNPYLDHAGRRPPRFSTKPSQAERAEEVRRGLADTDMTRKMIDDTLAIRTNGGIRVFEWGGDWNTVKDAMHFEIDVSPAELAEGIDWKTVKGWREPEPEIAVPDDDAAAAVAAGVPAATAERHVVIARRGLLLRSGPGSQFADLGGQAAGTEVWVIARNGEWAQVDLGGDGLADGYMHAGYLRAVGAPAAAPAAPVAAPVSAPVAAAPDAMSWCTAEKVKQMFPATPIANIQKNLPFVLAGLAGDGLTDKAMALMALATIRAETEGFRPIDEGGSRYNTRNAPFDLYDPGTGPGGRLGNTQPGDGARFKGRGYVQLTGRDNYTRIGNQLSVNLAGDPAQANDPAIAGRILARFLKNKEALVRAALARDDLKEARRLVNGGRHGLDRFTDAFRRGQAAL